MRPYLFDEDSENDVLLVTPFPLLYWYKSTDTDADAAASPRYSVSLALLVQKYTY